MSTVRDMLISALEMSFKELDHSVADLNKYVSHAVPTPPLVRPPKPRLLAPKWLLGIATFKVDPLRSNPGWYALYRDHANEMNHKSQIWLYRYRLAHLEPEPPPREHWQELLNENYQYDAMYYHFSPDRPGLEMICYDLGCSPSRIVAAIRKIRYFSRWCYYTRDRLMKLSARRLESRREVEAMDLIEDLFVEQKLKGGQP